MGWEPATRSESDSSTTPTATTTAGHSLPPRAIVSSASGPTSSSGVSTLFSSPRGQVSFGLSDMGERTQSGRRRVVGTSEFEIPPLRGSTSFPRRRCSLRPATHDEVHLRSTHVIGGAAVHTSGVRRRDHKPQASRGSSCSVRCTEHSTRSGGFDSGTRRRSVPAAAASHQKCIVAGTQLRPPGLCICEANSNDGATIVCETRD